ncbi:hypothetical protein PVT68_18170 [Microbulbifer bruguierae]|uniref:DUF3899 domain-containing protein n=1 Tax=Microbulbifer bruguierae TaxID=3029061 RepID=A0ABY8NCL0_9GAMM|nr:hypothetical protein [Microbulbifer bruguierae]WGL16664.1 hypothetical protein PVT68_18170 [Microbulbifer bruguierae]
MEADKEKVEIEKGVGFPQILHDRSRAVGQDLQKLLVSLSTAVLAVFFVTLTTKVEPPLNAYQKLVMLVSLSSMAFAVFAGVIDMYADSRRNFFWASALQAVDKTRRSAFYKHRDRWLKIERYCAWALTIGFFVGILAALAYMIMRLM